MKTETYNSLIIDYLTRPNRSECIENLKALSVVAFQDDDLSVIEALSIDKKITDILKAIKDGNK